MSAQRVVFFPLPELGHIMPTLELARNLVQSGLEVMYLTASPFTDIIASVGAYTHCIFPDSGLNQFSPGQMFWRSIYPSGDPLERKSWVEHCVKQVAENVNISLMLLDYHLTINYKCSFESVMLAQEYCHFSCSLPLWGDSTFEDLREEILVFCPVELEIPFLRRSAPKIRYVEPSVYLGLANWRDPLPPTPDSNLVLVSWGTQSHLSHEVLRLNSLVMNLASQHPELEFLIVTGPAFKANETLTWTANVRFEESINQIACLCRAKVFITHGGLGSVKESILMGVPMLVFPLAHDQPENAFRVRVGNCGSAILRRNQVPEAIENCLKLALEGQHLDGLRKMQELFYKKEIEKPSQAFIEQLLDRR